ncbi:hypothetical protein DFR50_11554 [Roseiarcus fermentans]|uniref:Uncharacterized protein n=1 Tax=Roseiarcus fermentans TaxID=1473586 RepID=A0A366FBG4_9HYPH|nr:hypothetical protein [Roseiarcus fermentans]RBP11947.1 hypothetical protein DFR50_11554 [Roseiarcus fermentans]
MPSNPEFVLSALPAGGASQRSRVDWRRPRKTLTTSLVDIDVAMTNIVFQHGGSLSALDSRRPSSVIDYAIEGVVRGAEPEELGDGRSDPVRLYVSGYSANDRLDRDEDIDQRSVCYIAHDRSPDRAWRTNIYIESAIFRRLVELYASKRIDFAKISVLLKVLRDPSGKVDVPVSKHPMLRAAGDRRVEHSRAHLMSVQTALAANPPVRWAQPPRPGW